MGPSVGDASSPQNDRARTSQPWEVGARETSWVFFSLQLERQTSQKQARSRAGCRLLCGRYSRSQEEMRKQV